jgi:hypothetical protein
VTLRLPQGITQPLSLLTDGLAVGAPIHFAATGLTYRHSLCIPKVRQSQLTRVPEMATFCQVAISGTSATHERSSPCDLCAKCDGAVTGRAENPRRVWRGVDLVEAGTAG